MKSDNNKDIKQKCLRLKDVSRSSILVDDIDNLKEIYNKLIEEFDKSDKFKIIQIKNMFKHKYNNKYK